MQELFSKLMENLAVKPDKKNGMMAMPLENKWLMIQQYETISQSEKENKAADHVALLKSVVSAKDMEAITVDMVSKPVPWLLEFVKEGGVPPLLVQLTTVLSKREKVKSDVKLLDNFVNCIRGLMNGSEEAIKAVSTSKGATLALIKCLDYISPKAHSNIWELLVALCYISDDSHVQLAKDLSKQYKPVDGKKKTSGIMKLKWFLHKGDDGCKGIVMTLVNGMINKCTRLDDRMATRSNIGIRESLKEKLGRIVNDRLALQLVIYTEEEEADELEYREVGSGEKESKVLFSALLENLRDKVSFPHFLSLLGHIELMRSDDQVGEDSFLLLDMFSQSIAHATHNGNIGEFANEVCDSTLQDLGSTEEGTDSHDQLRSGDVNQKDIKDLLKKMEAQIAMHVEGAKKNELMVAEAKKSARQAMEENTKLRNEANALRQALETKEGTSAVIPGVSNIPKTSEENQESHQDIEKLQDEQQSENELGKAKELDDPSLPGSGPPPPPPPPGGGPPPPPPPPGGGPPPPPPPPGGGPPPPPPPPGGGPPPPPPPPGGGPPPPPPPPGGGPPPPPGLGPPPPPGGGPPPPPGLGPPPPPGGGPPVALSGRVPKPKKDPPVKMKAFNWSKIPDSKIDGTIWEDMDEEQIIFDFKDLVSMFCSAIPKEIKAEGKSSKPKTQTILDFNRSNNINILVKRFKKTPQEMKNAIIECEDDLMTGDSIRALLKIVPTPDEIEAIKDFPNKEELGGAEKHLLALSDIPRLGSRLKALLIKSVFNKHATTVQEQMNVLEKAIDEVSGSNKLPQLLGIVLKVGNFMNGTGARGGAYGFKLSDLEKLADTKSMNLKTTLLGYLIQVFEQNNPDLINVPEDFPTASQASRESLIEVVKDVNQLESDRNFAKRLIEGDNVEHDVFYTKMASFLIEADASLEDLTARKTTIEQKFNKLKKSLFEPPFTDTCEFFETITKFMNLYQSTHDSIIRERKSVDDRAKAEKKRQVFFTLFDYF